MLDFIRLSSVTLPQDVLAQKEDDFDFKKIFVIFIQENIANIDLG